jgi:hypothetical protein
MIDDPVERYHLLEVIGRGRPWSKKTTAALREGFDDPDHALARQHGDPMIRRLALQMDFFGGLAIGDGDRARASAAALDELAETTRHPFIEAWAPFVGFQLHLVDGRLDECQRKVDLMAAHWSRLGWPSIEVYVRSASGQMAREAGLLPFVAGQLVPEPDDVPGVLAAITALAHREAGERDAVHDLVERCGRNGFRDVPDEGALPIARSCWSEAAAYARHDDACRRWYEILAADPELHFVTGGWYLGSTTRNLGLLTAALGRHDEATSWFELAVEAHERMRTPPWIARGLLDWADHELELGHRDRAVELADRALAAIGDLGLEASRARAGALREAARA